MVWFNFIGSVLNAVSQELVVLNQVPYLSLISFLTGFVIGLVAHIRGNGYGCRYQRCCI